MPNFKVLGALVVCALVIAVPSLAHGGPVVGKPLAKGSMQATMINAQTGSMIFERSRSRPAAALAGTRTPHRSPSLSRRGRSLSSTRW